MQTPQLSYRTAAAPASTHPEPSSQQAIEDKRKHIRVILRWHRASALRWLGFAVTLVVFAFIAMKILKANIAQSYKQPLPAPEDAVVTAARSGWSATLNALRLAHYPPAATAQIVGGGNGGNGGDGGDDDGSEAGALRYGAHTDYQTFTVLRADAAVGGLQVQLPDGRWLAPWLEGRPPSVERWRPPPAASAAAAPLDEADTGPARAAGCCSVS